MISCLKSLNQLEILIQIKLKTISVVNYGTYQKYTLLYTTGQHSLCVCLMLYRVCK